MASKARTKKLFFPGPFPNATVKKKYQVVIPVAVRRKLGIEVGDLLEAKFERGNITFTPKSVVDRRIKKGLEDKIAKKPGRAKRSPRSRQAARGR
ncbi:MAG: hypothetical protein A3J28_11670 [Acidobacteria bacterium RIFCSPLOWO2_12_FULL_60_22]|nr:MAG: hypothetical protein A3J28_11670 [Acidobacteria bacterium RIFCSPLOWO2_12_FULL_60_22]